MYICLICVPFIKNSAVAMVALLRMKYTCVHPAEVNLKPLRDSYTSRRT